MNAISYSIFGSPHTRLENCFDFHSYMRGLMINLRLNRLIFPGWDTVIHVNRTTQYLDFFVELNKLPNVRVMFCEDAPLCKAMLWRLHPIFEIRANAWKYSHVICRDVDSPTMYKDAQCVAQWIRHGKSVHAITDSVSHTIPMMGGMVGFKPDSFTSIMNVKTWEELMRVGSTYSFDFNRKGTDQDFLNRVIYPLVAQPGRDSITQHYMLGMGNTFLSDYHNRVPDEPLAISDEMKESNQIAGHIGASGYYEGETFRFLWKFNEQFKDIIEVEQMHKEIFFWPV